MFVGKLSETSSRLHIKLLLFIIINRYPGGNEVLLMSPFAFSTGKLRIEKSIPLRFLPLSSRLLVKLVYHDQWFNGLVLNGSSLFFDRLFGVTFSFIFVYLNSFPARVAE